MGIDQANHPIDLDQENDLVFLDDGISGKRTGILLDKPTSWRSLNIMTRRARE